MIIDNPFKWDGELDIKKISIPKNSDCIFMGMVKEGKMFFNFYAIKDWNDSQPFIDKLLKEQRVTLKQ